MITSDLPRGTFAERYFPSLISAEIACPVFDASGLKLIVPAGTGVPSTAMVPSTVLTGNPDPLQPAAAARINGNALAASLFIARLSYRAGLVGSTNGSS